MAKQPEKTRKSTEIATLADGEIFVRRDGAGMIRPFWKKVTLKKGRDTYVVSGKTRISQSGYLVCNVIANISIMRPNTLFVDARERGNPYVERNPITQEAVNVHSRALAIGFAPTGNPVIVDKTVILNLRQYFLTDLKTKIGKFPECGYFGVGVIGGMAKGSWESKPDYSSGQTRVITARSNAVMKFIPTREITPSDYVGYWFDLAHPEIIALYGQQDTRQQFAERNAITMSSRNAMSEHPCMPPKDCTDCVNKQTGDAIVTVYGYRHDASADDLKGLAQAAAEGDLTGVKRKGGAEAELHDAGTERIEYEEAQVEEVNAAEDAAEPEKEKKTSPPAGKKTSTRKKKEPQPAAEEKKPEPEPVANTPEEKAEEAHRGLGTPQPEPEDMGKAIEQEQGAPAGDYSPPGGAPPRELMDEQTAAEDEVKEPLEAEEPPPEVATEPPAERKQAKQPSRTYIQLEGAEHILKNPEMINQVAHEIFPDTEFKNWRELTAGKQNVLLEEMKKRTK